MNDVDLEKLNQLMEKLNDFFHQPLNFEKKEGIMKFAIEVYPEVRYFYYDLIPKLLNPRSPKNRS